MAKNRTTEDELSQDHEKNIYNISFKKKRTKSNIRFGAKLLVYLIIAAISGALFSKFMIDIKYGNAIRRIEEFTEDEMVISDYTKIIDILSPSIVTIGSSEESINSAINNNSNITGIILDNNGNILTNYSSIKNFQNIFVKLSSVASEPLPCKIIVKSEDIDLAIVKIETEEELVPVKFAEIDDIVLGQGIAILGNSNGANAYIDTVNPGIITSIDESISVNGKTYKLLQVSAPININNTGGPICNSKGEVVGLASYKVSEDKGNEFYYGIQLEDLKITINSANAFKSVLGVNEGGILADETNEFKGFYVQDLDKNGNAYKAGIKPTDIILEIDNEKIMSVEETTMILQNKKSGDTLNCKVLRDGVVKEIEVKIN